MSIQDVPHEGKEFSVVVNRVVYERYPLKTKTIHKGDDLLHIFKDAVGDFLQDGDIVLVAESIVAISEGRAFKFDEISFGKVAQFLSRFVAKSSAGIGLGTPQTMQLAINEVGMMRVLFAAFVAALTKPFGLHGMFYRIVGEKARGIDGPTSTTLPPYNEYASLIPKDPAGFAKMMHYGCKPKKVRFIVIDANDIGVNILGARDAEEEYLAHELSKDNPMGQSDESTPFLICRPLLK